MSDSEVNNSEKKAINHDRFIRIAERRVNQILDSLDNLGKCSNSKNYDYSDIEVRKIFREIDSKVREIKLRFKDQNISKRRFKL